MYDFGDGEWKEKMIEVMKGRKKEEVKVEINYYSDWEKGEDSDS